MAMLNYRKVTYADVSYVTKKGTTWVQEEDASPSVVELPATSSTLKRMSRFVDLVGYRLCIV